MDLNNCAGWRIRCKHDDPELRDGFIPDRKYATRAEALAEVERMRTTSPWCDDDAHTVHEVRGARYPKGWI